MSENSLNGDYVDDEDAGCDRNDTKDFKRQTTIGEAEDDSDGADDGGGGGNGDDGGVGGVGSGSVSRHTEIVVEHDDDDGDDDDVDGVKDRHGKEKVAEYENNLQREHALIDHDKCPIAYRLMEEGE